MFIANSKQTSYLKSYLSKVEVGAKEQLERTIVGSVFKFVLLQRCYVSLLLPT